MRPAGLRARGRWGAGGSSRDLLGGSRRLCGAPRELWEGCRRFWKGSGQKILDFHWFLKVLGGNNGWARQATGLGWDPLKQEFQRKPKAQAKGKAKGQNAGVRNTQSRRRASAVADIYIYIY